MIAIRTARRAPLVALVAALVMSSQSPAAAAEIVSTVASVGETTPVRSSGDAADDPAIWVNQADPAASLVIGNDKRGALETYNLDGTLVQRITTRTVFWGNIDVRGDLVAAWNGGGVRVYRVNPTTRLLVLATDGNGVIPTVGGEGVCLYQSPTALFVTAISIAGVVRQYRLGDADGDSLLEGQKVREFTVGSEAEGCVADDANGALYISQEDVALWRYGAEPGAGSARVLVDRVSSSGGHIAADAEGVTLAGDYLIVSAQNVANGSNSYFVVYERESNAFVKSFRVVNGAASDDCDTTDGITAYEGDLGPLFPTGVFICQDGSNATATGTSTSRQNFKLVPWAAI